VPIDGQLLLSGATTTAAAWIEPALQKAAQRKAATVASVAPLDTDPGGEKRYYSVSIELAQANTQLERMRGLLG